MKAKNNIQLIIGITGGSGSGKSSFIKALMNDFSKNDICLISQDDYYLPREEQEKDENGIRNFDLPESVDLDGLYKDFEKIISGESIEITEYTFNNKHKTPETKHISPAPVIILEGLYALKPQKIRDLCDLKIFINAEDVRKITRRIKRDLEERNYPLEDVLYRYENHVLPSYLKDIRPRIRDCDIIINNNESYDQAKEVLSAYIREFIRKTNAIPIEMDRNKH